MKKKRVVYLVSIALVLFSCDENNYDTEIIKDQTTDNAL